MHTRLSFLVIFIPNGEENLLILEKKSLYRIFGYCMKMVLSNGLQNAL